MIRSIQHPRKQKRKTSHLVLRTPEQMVEIFEEELEFEESKSIVVSRNTVHASWKSGFVIVVTDGKDWKVKESSEEQGNYWFACFDYSEPLSYHKSTTK